MPLRNLIKASPETFSDLLLAADDRYREGEELLMRGEFDGCVYLLGYAAEMWLKAACFRLQGVPPTAPVKAALPALRSWMRIQAPHVAFSDYHDLGFFAQFVMQFRRLQGRALPLPVTTELQSRVVNGMHAEWIVDMRYRRCGLAASDAWAALLNTWWLKNNWLSLT